MPIVVMVSILITQKEFPINNPAAFHSGTESDWIWRVFYFRNNRINQSE